MKNYDVIVIGGGHAGCEAAHASARLGQRTVLVTMNPERIGFMSCNPAIGGLGKSQIVKEVDALGGVMALNTDLAAIQYRKLNASKGPAVRSSRAQCDKAIYAREMQNRLQKQPFLEILKVEGESILTRNGKIQGLKLSSGETLFSNSIVITTGTFLKAVMHMGFEKKEGGRDGDSASNPLSESIRDLGFRLHRLKTGTPPRLHRRSIRFELLEKQPGDEKPEPFSYFSRLNRFPWLDQLNCFITYTNEQTHDIIKENFDKSPMFTGVISGVGPRYCPSVEDKVKRFADKTRHQIFLEPEGLDVDEIYVQGMSTSLPRDVQDRFFRSIKGLEQAEFIRYGYAVEYDAIDARQLQSTLMSKDIRGLFFAGQINGTSGYEEAAGQGLMAGINAARFAQNLDLFILDRSQAYIGVMIDDLVLRGTDEPYRMFSSRAEHRLYLREDNADLRFGHLGKEIGLLSPEQVQILEKKQNQISDLYAHLKDFYIKPGASDGFFLSQGKEPLKDRVSAKAILKRPEIGFSELQELGWQEALQYSPQVLEQVEIQIKYEGYIEREKDLMATVQKQEAMKIPANINFQAIAGLSTEVKTRLQEVRPENLGQAGRIPGVTPSAVANLMIHLKVNERLRAL